MNDKQIKEFAKLRLEHRLNNCGEVEIFEFANNCYIEEHKGFNWIDDGGHGYIIIPKTSPYYGIADKFSENYNYRLNDGTILLEEDCEAPKFLEAIKN